jgi:hypothetical protein
MQKEEIIKKVKEIIAEFGGFGTGEVEVDCSPCVGSLGNYVGLAEEFNLNGVEVNVYMPSGFSSDPVDDYELTYEELEKDVLEEILALCEQYKESQE